MCDECKLKHNAEAEQDKVNQQNELQRWIGELEVMKASDPILRGIVVEWSAANQGATPGRETVSEFTNAMRMTFSNWLRAFGAMISSPLWPLSQ